MAVVIQHLVGTDFGGRYYPTFSGVLRSHAKVPLPGREPEDGAVTLALGLGRALAEGWGAVSFSPLHAVPAADPEGPLDLERFPQRRFFALDMNQPTPAWQDEERSMLLDLGLEEAEADGSLRHVGSTCVPRAGSAERPSGSSGSRAATGERLVTFAPLLRNEGFPLAALLADLMHVGREAMGGPFEIELAANLDVPPGQRPELALLQIRPRPEDATELDTAG